MLVLDPGADASAWEAVASAAAVPHKTLAIPAGIAPAAYRHPLVLARGDGHVAWRGDALDAAAATRLVARLTGRAA